MSGKIIDNLGRSSGLIKAAAGGATSTVAASTTVGDGTAEDTKLVFDGNAQDFHIALDDSADDLVIGLGSTPGTTTHMSFDENGIIGMPLQPAWSGHLSSTQTIATGTWTKLALATELYDKNNDFDASTNYRFTVPVDGIYLICFNAMFGLTAGNDAGVAIHVNGSERFRIIDQPGRSGAHWGCNTTAMEDLDATDYIEFYAVHTEGGDDTVTGSKEYTYCMIQKIA